MGKSLVEMGAEAEVLAALDSPITRSFDFAFERIFGDEQQGKLGKDEAEQVEMTASDRELQRNLKGAHAEAQRWVDYRKRLMLFALKGSPTFTLDLVEQYAQARAREILALRALEGCGWAP